MPTIDVLMITYRSPERTQLSLDRLLEVANRSTRVWLWHNGDHQPTLDIVKASLEHPRVHRFHHSVENVRLRPPTNWLLTESTGDYLSKIDDDNVLPLNWPGHLLEAHEADARLGVLGSWRFQDEDYDPSLGDWKIQTFAGGHQVLRNLWVEGSCFLMKRACVDQQGPLSDDQSFTEYCRELALSGWANGYYYPFLRYENLDDPRLPNTFIHTDEDLAERLPLSAVRNGIETRDEWVAQLQRSARGVQVAEWDIKHWRGWRAQLRRVRRRIRQLRGDDRIW